VINLENLRKQAKQYVRWHRARHGTVAEVIRATLARYGHLTDAQVLEATFRLADAQELVARREGFESWKALLLAASSDATERGRKRAPEAAQRPRVLVARPFVFVRDVRSACAHYVGTLGFRLVFDYGGPPFYAEVERDGVRLCIRYTRDARVDAAAARREDVVLASFEVTDAKALYAELQQTGALFSQTLHVEPYGTRSFIVEDPDGNRLLFFDSYGVRREHPQDVAGRTHVPESRDSEEP
jgi:uncharacterized glyoxalase superfamily protein PhnB